MAGANIDDVGDPTLDDLHREIGQLRTALNQADALWRNTFEQAIIGMVHLSLDRKWLRVNEHFCAMLGYRADELYRHKPIQAVTHPADWAGNVTGMQQLIAGEITRYVTHKRYIHRNGNLIWGRLTLRLARTSEGAPDYFVAVIEDITALKQAEEALRVSEERYRGIVEDQVDPICRFGPDFCLTFVNGPYAKLYGKRPEALIGQNLFDIVVPAYRPQVLAHLSLLTPQHPLAVDENPITLADGSERWFHWTNRLIELPDGTIEYQGVGRDITDRKLADDAERQQRQLAEAIRDSLVALTSSLNVEEVMVHILGSAATVVPSDAGSIILFEDSYGRVAYSRGFSPEVAAALQQNRFAIDPLGNLRNALTNKAPYVVLDTHVAEDWHAFPLTSWIRSTVGVPIECNGQLIGLLAADSATPNFFQSKDAEILQMFAHYAGLALHNAYQAARLEQRVAERTAALQASETKFRQLFHAAPLPIVISDGAGRITLVNRQAEDFLGYQGDELLHQSIEVLMPEDVRNIHVHNRMDYTAQLRIREMGSGLELFVQCKDGHKVPVEIQLSYLETSDGLLVMSFIQDITERKKAAETLRQQRDFLQEVIDHVPGIITVKDREGRFQLVNQYTAQKLAATPFMMLGKTGSEVNPNQAEVDLVRRGTDKVLHDKQALFVPEVLLGGRYYQAGLIPLFGSTNEDAQVLIVGTDITERKQATENLSRQRDFLQQIVDQMPAIIMVKDQAGAFQLVNKHAAHVYGTTTGHMIGKTDADVNPYPTEVTFFRQKDQEAFTTGQPIFVPEQTILGTYYQINKIPLTNEANEIDRLLVVAVDISTHKEAEVALAQALQTEKALNEHKSRFITTISHEFRTPLAVILSLTETLTAYRHKLPNDQIEQRLLKIKQQIEHLKTMLTDVLELERIRTTQVSFTPTDLDPSAFCGELLTSFQDAFAVTQRLVYQADASMPQAKLDANLLRKIVTNLLTNAVKYSPTDSTVTFTVTHAGKMLILQVQDQGIGISAADLKHLFQPFYRASNAENIPGTGLGLSIIKEAVALHGGTITVESTLGVSTTFTVQIPITTP